MTLLAVLAPGLIPPLDVPAVDPVEGTGFAGRPAPDDGPAALAGLERWDALWYLAIAEHGYPAVAAGGDVPEVYAFFPLYPLLVGALGRLLPGGFLLAASLVSFVAAVVALAGVHRLVEVERGDRLLAGRAVVTVAVLPSAYFLVAPYPEGLFLALSVWALVAARRQVWPAAALLAAAAATARPLGVLLLVALAAEVVRQHRAGRRVLPRALPAIVAAPAGAALVFAWGRARTGSWIAPVAAQEGWLREASWPHLTLLAGVRRGAEAAGAYPGGYAALDAVLFVPVVAAVVWLLVRTPPTYGLYALAHLVAWLVNPFPGRPLMSTYRFALGVAPLGWAVAAWTRRPEAAHAWWAGSAALLGAMTVLFAASYYVF